MMLFRNCLSLVIALLYGVPACADLTLIGRSSLGALNMANQGREALYIKQHQMRRDLVDRGRSYSYLYDLKNKELVLIDHMLRQARVHDLGQHPAAKPDRLKLALNATGRKHTLQGWYCEEHDMTASLPAMLGQEAVTVILSGQVWLDRKTQQRRQVTPFIKSVEVDDFFIGAAMPGQPANAQARGINEVMRQVLGKGMLCAAEVGIKYAGSGPMADLGRRMATKASLVYETVASDALKIELFRIPDGYQVLPAQ